MNTNIKAIHDSFMNGQRRQMVEQIDEYGSDFWRCYRAYLIDEYPSVLLAYGYFSDITITYAENKARWTV